MIFIARFAPVFLCSANTTRPKPPSPRVYITLYSSPISPSFFLTHKPGLNSRLFIRVTYFFLSFRTGFSYCSSTSYAANLSASDEHQFPIYFKCYIMERSALFLIKIYKLKKMAIRGYVSIFGGFLQHLALGCMYLWGNISIYIVSYYHHMDSSTTHGTAFYIFPLALICSNIFFYLGAHLAIAKDPRLPVALGFILIGGGPFLSSFVESLYWFSFFYASLFGLGVGMAYFSPILVGWSYFEEHKGRVSGLVVTGFGLGAAIFNQITTAVVNPDNKEPDAGDDGSLGYYDWEISSRVPLMLRIIAIIWFCLGILAFLLIAPIKKSEIEKPLIRGTYIENMGEGMKTRHIYILCLCCFLSSAIGMFMLGNFKLFAQNYIPNDRFLTICGSVASICNGLFRIFAGWFFDWTNFKATYCFVVVLQTILIMTLWFVKMIPGLFLVWFGLIGGLLGCHYALFPSICGVLYGKTYGGKMYSLIYPMFAFTTLLQNTISYAVVEKIGWFNMFVVEASFSVAALVIILVFFKEPPKLTDGKAISLKLN